MSGTVWKYTLRVTDAQTVEMPTGAEILTVAEQRGEIAMWARVDPHPAVPVVARHFAVVGTGAVAPSTGVYRGTAVTNAGMLVWHVFEEVA